MIFEHIISAIAPFACLGCNAEGSILCTACQTGLPTVETSSASVGTPQYMVATTYTDVAKDVVHALKFDRARQAATCIAKVMASRAQLPKEPCIVSHVPTATTRVRQRGYDQAQIIAQAFARATALPYVSLLARQTNTRQVGASKEARLSQAAEMFRIKGDVRRYNATVLLIDDVITTGATMQAAAQVLTEAGVPAVRLLAFARVE